MDRAEEVAGCAEALLAEVADWVVWLLSVG